MHAGRLVPQFDPPLGAVGINEAEVNGLGLIREEGEVGPEAVVVRAERVPDAWPLQVTGQWVGAERLWFHELTETAGAGSLSNRRRTECSHLPVRASSRSIGGGPDPVSSRLPYAPTISTRRRSQAAISSHGLLGRNCRYSLSTTEKGL